MNIYTGMLFQQGFIQDVQLALSLGSGASLENVPGGRHPASSKPADGVSRPCKPFKRGAIAAVCSIALSPFR